MNSVVSCALKNGIYLIPLKQPGIRHGTNMVSRFIASRQVRMEPADRTMNLAQYLAYNGRCAVQLGADGKRFDYRKHADHIAGGTVYPRSLQARPPERVAMWQTLQAHAPDNMEVIATALIATLPRGDELSQAERVALIEAFCEPVAYQGHIIDWNMHRGRDGNWHVHFLVSAGGMLLDKRKKPLASSPFRSSAYMPEETNEAGNVQAKQADAGKKKREIINPPWQRLWRVAQERFFKRRGIDLRVPASSMTIRDKNDQQRTVLPPAAAPGGYASREDVADWRTKRCATFSDPALYGAALTRDRLLIDRADIDAFNAMIWNENEPPAPIRRLVADFERSDHPLTMERVDNGEMLRFGNGTFSSRKNIALLYRAMRAAHSLDHATFIDQTEIPVDIGTNFLSIACTESIGMVSGAKPEHLLPIKGGKFQPKGLTPIIDRVARYAEPIFISTDHISYCRYAKALEKKDWALIGISELLRKKSLASCAACKRGRKRDLTRGVMLIVLDAQRISEPRLAALICVAEKLQRELGRLRLLLMKPDDIIAEQSTPFLDWLSRSARHYHCSDPDQPADKHPRFKPAAKKPWEVTPAIKRNTFPARYPGGSDAPLEPDLTFDDLPSEFNRAGISRHERYKAIVTHLAPENKQPAKPQIQRHPLIVVASMPGMDAEATPPEPKYGRDGAVAEAPGSLSSPDLQRLRPDDKVVITADLPDQALSAGTVLTIRDVNAEKGVFWYTRLGSDDPYSVPADLACHFLPLDIVTLRDAFVIIAHAEKIRQQLDFNIYVIVSEPEHAGALLAFAESLDQKRRRVIVDRCLCASPDQLIAVIDKSAFCNTLDALSEVIDTKPRIRALYGNEPDAYDMYEALGVFDGADLPRRANALRIIPAARPADLAERQDQPDDDHYDDALDVDEIVEHALNDADPDQEYDPDIALPEFWNDNPRDDLRDDPSDQPYDDADFDYEDDPDPDR
jgi:hypothetical protein